MGVCPPDLISTRAPSMHTSRQCQILCSPNHRVGNHNGEFVAYDWHSVENDEQSPQLFPLLGSWEWRPYNFPQQLLCCRYDALVPARKNIQSFCQISPHLLLALITLESVRLLGGSRKPFRPVPTQLYLNNFKKQPSPGKAINTCSVPLSSVHFYAHVLQARR